jgi:tetratricopeptide (TPR) repeat protein
MQLRLGMSEQANVADTMLDLGAALMKKGDFSLAESNIAAALAMRRKVLGPTNSEVAEALDTLAVLKASGGELQEAEQLLRDALIMTRQETAPDHPDLVPVLLHLSWVLGQENQPSEANQLHAEALAIAGKRRLCGGQSLSDAICDLTDTLAARGKFTDAEPIFVELEKFCQSTEINQTLVHRHALLRGAHFYQAWDTAAPSSGQAAKAASCKQKAVDLVVPSTTGKN